MMCERISGEGFEAFICGRQTKDPRECPHTTWEGNCPQCGNKAESGGYGFAGGYGLGGYKYCERCDLILDFFPDDED